LADQFPGSSHVVIVGLEKADDRAVWRPAAANDFLLVSLDGDFAEMAALLGPPPKVIWLRCGNQPTRTIENLLRRHADAIAVFASDDVACLEIYETDSPGTLAEPSQ
jgi:predicted nuclease of predicted toxin-antitoxin system